MRRRISRLLMIAAIAPLALMKPALAIDETCKQIRFAEPGWTDLTYTTNVASQILEAMGYETDVKILGIPVIYKSLEKSYIDVFLGYWNPAMESYAKDYLDKGSVETVHQNLTGAKFTFAVPDYVHAAGITDFADLAKHADSFEKKLYGIEAGSNEIMLDIVAKDAFGLGDWEVIESSEQAMLAQVARAIKRKRNIVFLGWAPHPMNNSYDLAYLTGGDDFYGPDFGGATVHSQVRKGYLQECPNIARFLTQLTFTIEMENASMAYILEEALSPEEAARKTLLAHPEKLESWLSKVKTIDGEPALPAVKQALGL